MVPVPGLVSSSGHQKPKLRQIPKYHGRRAELCQRGGHQTSDPNPGSRPHCEPVLATGAIGASDGKGGTEVGRGVCVCEISHPRAGIWGSSWVQGDSGVQSHGGGAAAAVLGPQGPPLAVPSRPLPALGAGWRPARNSSGVGFRSGRCLGRGRKMPGRGGGGDRPREHPPAARVSQLLMGTQPGTGGGFRASHCLSFPITALKGKANPPHPTAPCASG